MPTATRTFRIFVSSTLEGLKAERDALQREVLPRLRKQCEENNARFQAIDLRWGVRDEAALDQQIRDLAVMEAGPFRRLRQLGVPRALATTTAASSHSCWRMTNSPALSLALPLAHFDAPGLPRLSAGS